MVSLHLSGSDVTRKMCWSKNHTTPPNVDNNSTLLGMIIPKGGIVLVPHRSPGTNGLWPGVLRESSPKFPSVDPNFHSTKLYTGKLVACEYFGSKDYNLEDELFTIETNVSW